MTMITASTSLTIFIMNIHFCGAEAKPVPHWAKVLIIDYMAKLCFVYEVGENCTSPEDSSTPLYTDEPMSSGYHDDAYYGNHYLENGHYGNGQYNQRHDSGNYRHHNQHNNLSDGRRLARVQRNGPQRGGDRRGRDPAMPHIMRDSNVHIPAYDPLEEKLKASDLSIPEKLQVYGYNQGNDFSHESAYRSSNSYRNGAAVRVSCPCGMPQKVVENIEYIANCFREQRSHQAKGAEWKKVAKVMDRFFMWIFFIMVFLMSILVIGQAT